MKRLHEHTKDFRKQPIKEIMTKEGLVKVHKDTHIVELIKLMEKHDVTSFPVVDDEDDFIGDVHERDLLKLSINPKDLTEYDIVGFMGTKLQKTEFEDKVEDVMKKHNVIARPDDTIEQVALEMWRDEIRHIPIVKGEEEELVGRVTEEVIIEKIYDHLDKKEVIKK